MPGHRLCKPDAFASSSLCGPSNVYCIRGLTSITTSMKISDRESRFISSLML